MEVNIGLDVSLASTAVCVLGETGKVATEAQVASAPDALVSFMRELPHGIAAIGLEAAPRALKHLFAQPPRCGRARSIDRHSGIALDLA